MQAVYKVEFILDEFTCGKFVYKPTTHYKPTLLFRADAWGITRGLIIHSYGSIPFVAIATFLNAMNNLDLS